MERYRGHFYNWYDTADLEPLRPRYVSTVDSGNLAAVLLTVKQGCLELVHAPTRARADGTACSTRVDILGEVIDRRVRWQDRERFASLRACVARTRQEVAALKAQRRAWAPGVARLLERECAEFDQTILSVIDPASTTSIRTCSPSSASGLPKLRRAPRGHAARHRALLPWLTPGASAPLA